ncbi:MAG: hypothetical protein PLY_0590 [Periwinkle leaf yellowing phytoplasma]|nr:MAG: hypothetical protein PLY_0590 [Periwinkle leaf yellowing phytoplasma]
MFPLQEDLKNLQTKECITQDKKINFVNALNEIQEQYLAMRLPDLKKLLIWTLMNIVKIKKIIVFFMKNKQNFMLII